MTPTFVPAKQSNLQYYRVAKCKETGKFHTLEVNYRDLNDDFTGVGSRFAKKFQSFLVSYTTPVDSITKYLQAGKVNERFTYGYMVNNIEEGTWEFVEVKLEVVETPIVEEVIANEVIEVANVVVEVSRSKKENPFQKSETIGRLKLKRHSNELNFNNLKDSEGLFCSYDMENESLLVEVKDREIPWSRYKDAVLELPKYNKLIEYSQKLNKDSYYIMFFTDDVVVKVNVNQLDVAKIKPTTVMANKTTAVNSGKKLKEWYNIKEGMAGVEVIKLNK